MRYIRMAAAMLALAAGAAFLRAESAEPDVKQAWMDARVKKMTDELVLTPEQQTKVRTALQSQQEKMDTLRKETEQKRRDILEKTDQNVSASLTPEQKDKYAKMKENMNQRDAQGPGGEETGRGEGAGGGRHGGHGGRGGWGGGMGGGGWER